MRYVLFPSSTYKVKVIRHIPVVFTCLSMFMGVIILHFVWGSGWGEGLTVYVFYLFAVFSFFPALLLWNSTDPIFIINTVNMPLLLKYIMCFYGRK